MNSKVFISTGYTIVSAGRRLGIQDKEKVLRCMQVPPSARLAKRAKYLQEYKLNITTLIHGHPAMQKT
jgi:hypothetical protein